VRKILQSKSIIVTPPHIELCQLLKLADLCSSGGEAKQVIADGQVLRNGEIETRKRAKIKPGDIIVYAETEVTIAFEGQES
jgi:ribosome-associated protein